ncbi:hypothetical protein ABPG72_005639, partial [Tetrahymena utriculariae]
MDPSKFNDYLKDKKYQLFEDSLQQNIDKISGKFLKQKKPYRLKGVLVQQQKYRQQYFEILKKIQKNPHKNIAQIYELTQKDDLIIYSQEYYNQTLQNLDQLKQEQKKQVAIDILNGITFLHSLGISHLNLKPSNILINNKFEAKIADLYYEAKQVCEEDYIYQGPEQLINMNTRNVAIQSDYYSVGALISEILGFNYKKNRQEIQQGIIPIIEDTKKDSLKLSFSLNMMHYSQFRRFTPAQTLETFLNDDQHMSLNQKLSLFSFLILSILAVLTISYYLIIYVQYNYNIGNYSVKDNNRFNQTTAEKVCFQNSDYQYYILEQRCKGDIFFAKELNDNSNQQIIHTQYYLQNSQNTYNEEVQHSQQEYNVENNQLEKNYISYLETIFSFISLTCNSKINSTSEMIRCARENIIKQFNIQFQQMDFYSIELKIHIFSNMVYYPIEQKLTILKQYLLQINQIFNKDELNQNLYQQDPISCMAFNLKNMSNNNFNHIQLDENSNLQIEGFWQLNKICIKQYNQCLIQSGIQKQDAPNVIEIEYDRGICFYDINLINILNELKYLEKLNHDHDYENFYMKILSYFQLSINSFNSNSENMLANVKSDKHEIDDHDDQTINKNNSGMSVENIQNINNKTNDNLS